MLSASESDAFLFEDCEAAGESVLNDASETFRDDADGIIYADVLELD